VNEGSNVAICVKETMFFSQWRGMSGLMMSERWKGWNK